MVKNNTNGLVAIHSLDKEMVEDEKRSEIIEDQ